MPDIDPAALGRLDGTMVPNGSSTPVTASKTLPGATPSSAKANKTAAPTPRIDLEPIYTSLKSAVSSHYWSIYKDAISGFILGHLNHDELTRATEHFILADAARERLHNQLVCGIYANAQRDTPDDGLAVFVSETDKPPAALKPPSGDAEERRLKHEVMQLPPRFRHRLKAIQDEPHAPITHSITTHAAAKRIQHISPSSSALTASGPTPAPSSAALNRDTDIRRRYAQPLISETRDLPAPSTLADRLLPLCYEEGLAQGAAHPAATADLLSTALDMFLREALASTLGRCQTDRPVSAPEELLAALSAAATAPPPPPPQPSTDPSSSTTPTPAPPAPAPPPAPQIGGLNAVSAAADPGVLTAAYRRALDRDTAALARGDIKRTDAGLLPCEAAATARGAARPRDLRIAWELGDAWLGGLVPWIGERIVLGEHEGYYEGDEEGVGGGAGVMADGDGDVSMGGVVGEVKVVKAMAVPVPDGDAMQVDEPDWSWQGAGAADRMVLGSLLDDCLAVGT